MSGHEHPAPFSVQAAAPGVLSAGPLSHLQLMAVFNAEFGESHNTCLSGGGDEPIYLPADGTCSEHRIIFTRDYGASALHEVAHWLVAGEARRQLVDFGYWYAPDGRTEAQQRAFERVEVKPQAIEWMLSVAAGRHFRVSADNLEAGLGASDVFKQAIHRQVHTYLADGVPERTARLLRALQQASGISNPLDPRHYDVSLLDAFVREVECAS